mmetsp:Transcript_34255/g.63912  ORF Transcript_34255/g.63912 Transcript_34255/m.63912 type:complete len:115 (+) Transcript_34255:423-767(+)
MVAFRVLCCDIIADFLTSLGFVPNKEDKCVWNTTCNGGQLTVMLYVDDLLITSKCKTSIDWLINQLRKKFDNVKEHREHDLSYLGMHIKWGEPTLHHATGRINQVAISTHARRA